MFGSCNLKVTECSWHAEANLFCSRFPSYDCILHLSLYEINKFYIVNFFMIVRS